MKLFVTACLVRVKPDKGLAVETFIDRAESADAALGASVRILQTKYPSCMILSAVPQDVTAWARNFFVQHPEAA